MPRSFQPGDEPVPGFRLRKFLGRGGFGEVWESTAPGGTHCALKLIRLDQHQGRLEFQALQLVKQIRHPNLVPILALWIKDAAGRVYDPAASDLDATQAVELVIALGLGDGNLFDRAEDYRRRGLPGLPVIELLNLLEEAARALDYLNSPRHDLGHGPTGIQHCDVKPQNLLLVGDSVQVCDFGLARALGETEVRSSAGSPAYTAPEVICERQPSRTTDQYSLAISYVELRTGELPFAERTSTGVIDAHIHGKLDLSRLPPTERDVIRRATARKPEQRFESCLQLIRALRLAIDLPEAEQTPVEPFRSASPSGIRRGGPAGLIVGAELVPGYKLVRQLVRDVRDEVWEAAAPGGKPVALLIRDLRQVADSLDLVALNLVQRLEHPHLTELHAFWLLDEEYAVTGEPPSEVTATATAPVRLVIAGKLAKRTVRQELEERRKQGEGGLPAAEAVRLISQVAAALDYLNAAQHLWQDEAFRLVHRQVRPGNLLLYGNDVRLGNYSFARAMPGERLVVARGGTGLTDAYAPPEAWEGMLSHASDQYALALTYAELRSGQLPFTAQEAQAVGLRAPPQPQWELCGMSPAEVAVVSQATAIVPGERFANCQQFAQALAVALREPNVIPAGVRQVETVRRAVGSTASPTVRSATETVIHTDSEITVPTEPLAIRETVPLAGADTPLHPVPRPAEERPAMPESEAKPVPPPPQFEEMHHDLYGAMRWVLVAAVLLCVLSLGLLLISAYLDM